VTRRYTCTRCDTETPRDDLTVKKASFFLMGVGGKAVRSRVVDHLCPTCLVADTDWNRPKFDAPGNKVQVVVSG
jgi:hypothetical protein